MKFNKNLKYGASALALALLLSACSGENAKNAKEDAKDAVSNTKAAVSEEVNSVKDKAEDKKDEMTTGIEDKEFKISLDDAVKKFKEEFKAEEIEVSSLEFDEDNGKYAYDIKGFNGNDEYEAKIDADSGEILSKEQDKENDADNKKAIDFTKIKDAKEAIKKALENNKGFVKSYELDVNDEGKTIYEIDVVGGDDVELDAETLDIIQK
ncbi:PepSY domain-containing protein [Anaerococcus vaginalis]|uniref:PepSY domain-containing protein n=1 Tax=Anaerococcus vaginalis TaxID=33037 RepID=UPI00288A40B2|nr:PepSY domain-containing protein [Anaerococcus vaginalis]MDU2376004.1 PepSY domain-containing protein [Anaerococcus vaginalis]MDU7143006.1 PepSY domain-containing protein [Anaerococcus vaginalis]